MKRSYEQPRQQIVELIAAGQLLAGSNTEINTPGNTLPQMGDPEVLE